MWPLSLTEGLDSKRVEERTICALGDAAAWPIQGLMKNFRVWLFCWLDHACAIRLMPACSDFYNQVRRSRLASKLSVRKMDLSSLVADW